MREEEERLKKLVHGTVSMLCRNTVAYEHGLHIEGVIRVTVDDSDVFQIHINDTFGESQYSMPHDTQYCQNIKSEDGYNDSVGQSHPELVTMHGYQMPYSHSTSISAASAAAGSEHISDTFVTESFIIKTENMVEEDGQSFIIKTENMAEEDGQWGDTYEDSYSDLTYPLMDTNPYMSSSDSFYQQSSDVQHHSKPRMPVSLCFVIRLVNLHVCCKLHCNHWPRTCCGFW